MVNNTDLFQKAFNYHQAGNLIAASTLYHKVLENLPRHVDAIFLLGTLSLQQGNLDSATAFFRKTLSLKPDHVVAYNNLGTVLQEQGKLEEAVENFNQAIALKPDYVDAYYNLGNTLKEQGKINNAVENYRQAIVLKPDNAEAHYNLGNALKEQGKLDKAVRSYEKAIALKANYAMAHCNLATALQELGKIDEAIAGYKQAIELKPDYEKAYSNLGSILQELGKLDEAVESCRHAIKLKSDYAMAHCNLAIALQKQGKLDEAMSSFDKATTLKPDDPLIHKNRALVLLLTENFKQGWLEHEWRLCTKDYIVRNLKQSMWDGSPLNGRSILVHAEQGYGDTFQFIRYLPMVKAQGGHVIFECQQSLFRLLQSFIGFDEIIEWAPTCKLTSQFDVHVPIMSLPGIFDTTLDNIPSDIPYIRANSSHVDKWKIKLGHKNDLKIGLAWAGNPKHGNDRNRSCSLADFAPLAEIPELAFYSLQKGQASVEVFNPPEGMNIINLERELSDFADTAAAIANLDLVISVDTAVVHLAGAIGKPVWTLLPFAPDWRWFLDRDDSPWYPSMHLFRQTQAKDWAGVFERVKKALLQKLTMERHETSLKVKDSLYIKSGKLQMINV